MKKTHFVGSHPRDMRIAPNLGGPSNPMHTRPTQVGPNIPHLRSPTTHYNRGTIAQKPNHPGSPPALASNRAPKPPCGCGGCDKKGATGAARSGWKGTGCAPAPRSVQHRGGKASLPGRQPLLARASSTLPIGPAALPGGRLRPRGGGVFCDIPPWVKECLVDAIQRFNAYYPPIETKDVGEISGTPDDIEVEARRQIRWKGFMVSEPGVLDFVQCTGATPSQLRAIEMAYGGAGDFAGWIGEQTSTVATVSYQNPRPGALGGGLYYRSTDIQTFGGAPWLLPSSYAAISCPPSVPRSIAPERTPGASRSRRNVGPLATGAWGSVPRGLISGVIYDGRRTCEESGGTTICRRYPFGRGESYTIGMAYNRANAASPPTPEADPAARAARDLAWLEAFFGTAKENWPSTYEWRLLSQLANGGIEAFFEDFLQFSRGIWIPESSLGAVPFEDMEPMLNTERCLCHFM